MTPWCSHCGYLRTIKQLVSHNKHCGDNGERAYHRIITRPAEWHQPNRRATDAWKEDPKRFPVSFK